jgi:hypothetical protein
MDGGESVCPQCGHGLKEYGARKAKADSARQAAIPKIDMADLAGQWHGMPPAARRKAIRSRILGPDRRLLTRIATFLGFGRPPTRPSAARVAARAMTLAAIVARGNQELGLDMSPGLPLTWLGDLRIAGELEKQERDFLRKPLGRAGQSLSGDACWRVEGLAVLAWALQRFTLPPYDAAVGAKAAQNTLGFENRDCGINIIGSATLRSSADIDLFATQATLVTWRMRTFRLYPGPWDFIGHLRGQPGFRESWLNGLRIIDGDLAIGVHSISMAPTQEVERCERIALERQIAAYWLQGDAYLYSRVDPSTLLAAC